METDRRSFVKAAGIATVAYGAMSASGLASPLQSRTPFSNIKALAFDAYGTLFDVFSVTALCEALFPGNGTALAQLWRAKQLQYSLLRSLMGRSETRSGDRLIDPRYGPTWPVYLGPLTCTTKPSGSLNLNDANQQDLQNGADAPQLDSVVARVRSEYSEMPGLQLTCAPACRLWHMGIEPRRIFAHDRVFAQDAWSAENGAAVTVAPCLAKVRDPLAARHPRAACRTSLA
jgi:hypothetical protein